MSNSPAGLNPQYPPVIEGWERQFPSEGVPPTVTEINKQPGSDVEREKIDKVFIDPEIVQEVLTISQTGEDKVDTIIPTKTDDITTLQAVNKEKEANEGFKIAHGNQSNN